jgi:polyisoprenoid-binding protein YceI
MLRMRTAALPALRLAALALLFGTCTAATAQAGYYVFDPARSFVHFEVLHFGTSTIRGRIGPVPGSVTIDRAARSGSVSLRIPTATVSTGVPEMDARLRDADLLGSVAYPEAYYVSSDFRFDAQGQLAELRGEFTLRGVSRPLALRMRRFGCHTHPLLQREVCGGDFEGELRRTEFGADFGVPVVGDLVRLVVQVEGIKR